MPEAPLLDTAITATPIGTHSEKVYAAKEHAIIGISPFNSYFTEENLLCLLKWGLQQFNHITVFLPDKISAFTLEAMGYSHARARQKTRRQDSYLYNKTLRALTKLGLTPLDIKRIIVPLTSLLANPRYQELYNFCLKEFESNKAFRISCLSTSQWVLSGKITGLITEEAACKAVQYFLYELPLFINTPYILGLKSSVFIYHSVPTYLEQLYTDGMLVAPTQGFLKANLV